MKYREHDEVVAQNFRADPIYSLQLLDEVIRDGDHSELAILLRQINRAFGHGSCAESQPSI